VACPSLRSPQRRWRPLSSPPWIGAATFALLSLAASGDVAPDWPTGLARGLGGLAGGYLGAVLQPRIPETVLRYLLVAVAAGVGALYAIQGLS